MSLATERLVEVAPPSSRVPHRRLVALMSAGLVDSLILSMAWTVVVLRVTSTHGLVGAGLCSTAMLLGVALSAPFAGWLSRRLDGRRLLRTAAGVEAALRLAVFVLLYAGAPLWALAACVTAMNVVAWTGYAGMRAEVAAVSDGAVGITWYATIVASVEAVGVALAALLPVSGTRVPDRLWAVMGVVYLLGLLPTILVAGGSRVPKANAADHLDALPPRRSPRARPWRAVATNIPSMPVVVGSLLMLVASAPPLLAVALAAELHGMAAVGMAAVAFTVGSLASPMLVGALSARGLDGPVAWTLLAAGIVTGWALAPWSVAWLCVAQLASGACMTSLEGLVDSFAAARRPTAVTATLARTTAGRALGSAGGSAAFPALVLAVGLSATTLALGLVLVGTAVLVRVVQARRT